MYALGHQTEAKSLPCVVTVNVTDALAQTLKQSFADTVNFQFNDCVSALQRQIANRCMTGDTVLLGVGVDEPVGVAQLVHSFDKTIPVLILCDPDRHDELQREIMFAPLLGNEVTPWSIAKFDGLARALTSAIERRRQRRNYLDTLATTQTKLGSLSLSQPEVTHYLDRLLDQAPIGVLSIDLSTRILGINRQAERILRVGERDAQGARLPDFFSAQAREELNQLLQESTETQIEQESPRILKDGAKGGTVRYLEATATPIAYHGGQRGFMLILQDVTAREQAERSREQAQATLREHASILHAFHEITSKQDLTFGAKCAQLMDLGCHRFGLSVGVLSRIDNDSYEIFISTTATGPYAPGNTHSLDDTYCMHATRSSEPVAFENGRTRTSKGLARRQRSLVSAYLGARVMVDGKLYGTLCFLDPMPLPRTFDSTDIEVLKLMTQWVENELQREKAAEAARMHHAELAHVARLSTLGEMSSGLSHELSQPLCAIMTYAQTCLRIIEDSTRTKQDIRYGLDRVVEQAELANEIFSRLRDFARKGANARKQIDLREVVRDVATLIHADLAHREVALNIESDDGFPYAQIDPIQIEQVILNLVRNGIDAVADNQASAKSLTIKVTSDRDDQVKVSVLDTGRGCPANVADRLFEPFFTTKPSGLGIGLPISQTIVEDHGGKLWLEKNSAGGATFSFTLPPPEEVLHVS